jgi:hypothetical protein
MTDKSLLEKLAALEHEQWAHWTEYMVKSVPVEFSNEDIKRWRRQIETPYEELSEYEKDSDRRWASKVLVTIMEHYRLPIPKKDNTTSSTTEGSG